MEAAARLRRLDPSTLRAELDRRAQQAGFDAVGITSADAIPQAAPRLHEFVAKAYHGTMDWMAETADRRQSPRALWPEARSVIMLGMNYGPDHDPLAALDARSSGVISVYAQGRDYHDVIKGRLKQIAGWLHSATGHEVKVFVDTAPVMEKPLAEAGGIGWQGKHTNLVSRDLGSWLFLGAIFTSADLPADAPEQDYCGSCRKCLDICPTNAFPAPYQLDARRCISYLTIEHKGHIPAEFREAMGNRIYGCDDCLAVCPWNKFAQESSEAKLRARDSARSPALSELLALDDAAFRARFSGSPIKRIGRNRFIRNVLIAAGNSGDQSLRPQVVGLLREREPVVRAMAVWALCRLSAAVGDLTDWERLKAAHLPGETDAQVRAEWESGA